MLPRGVLHKASEIVTQAAARQSFGIALISGLHPILPCKTYTDILPFPSPHPIRYNQVGYVLEPGPFSPTVNTLGAKRNIKRKKVLDLLAFPIPLFCFVTQFYENLLRVVQRKCTISPTTNQLIFILLHP